MQGNHELIHKDVALQLHFPCHEGDAYHLLAYYKFDLLFSGFVLAFYFFFFFLSDMQKKMLDRKEKRLKWENPGSSTRAEFTSADSSGEAVQWKDVSETDNCWAETQPAASFPPPTLCSPS